MEWLILMGDKLNRAIGVFVIDLASLAPRIQMLWKGFELEKQESCKINDGFVKNLIEGRWVTQHWIFHVLLEEMKIINAQCKAMELPALFYMYMVQVIMKCRKVIEVFCCQH